MRTTGFWVVAAVIFACNCYALELVRSHLGVIMAGVVLAICIWCWILEEIRMFLDPGRDRRHSQNAQKIAQSLLTATRDDRSEFLKQLRDTDNALFLAVLDAMYEIRVQEEIEKG